MDPLKSALAAVRTGSGNAAHERPSHRAVALAVAPARAEAARLDGGSVRHWPAASTLRGAPVRMPDDEGNAILAGQQAQGARRLDAPVGTLASAPGRMGVLRLEGRPAPTLLRHGEAEGIDALVPGAVGGTGVARLPIGPTAETILGRVGSPGRRRGAPPPRRDRFAPSPDPGPTARAPN